MRVGMSKMKSSVVPSCRGSPLTQLRRRTDSGSNSVSIQGPSGQDVSKPLARDHCGSDFCRSRSVTSFAAT